MTILPTKAREQVNLCSTIQRTVAIFPRTKVVWPPLFLLTASLTEIKAIRSHKTDLAALRETLEIVTTTTTPSATKTVVIITSLGSEITVRGVTSATSTTAVMLEMTLNLSTHLKIPNCANSRVMTDAAIGITVGWAPLLSLRIALLVMEVVEATTIVIELETGGTCTVSPTTTPIATDQTSPVETETETTEEVSAEGTDLAAAATTGTRTDCLSS